MNLVRQWILRWFVPPSLQRDTTSEQQAVRAVLFALALLVWWPLFTPAYYLLGSPAGAGMITLAAVGVCGTVLSLRFTQSLTVTGNLLSGVLFALLIAIAWVTGGAFSPALWWLCAVPIIAIVLCGVPSGLFWVATSCLATGVFTLIAYQGIPIRNDIQGENSIILQLLSLCGIILCAFILTMTFKLSELAVQKDLESARDAAEQANRAKSMLLANMSHEIRTPMNAIIGMTNLVLGTELADDQRDYLEVVQQSGANLLVLIDDILDFSVIEARRFELNTTPFKLQESLKRSVRALGAQAHKGSLELICWFDPTIPPVLIGDQDRLRQVIVNLVGNALKFTHEGEVVLEVRRGGRSESAICLHFLVRDTGIGIPNRKRDVIFNVFEQAEMSNTRRDGGAGLGLAISSQLVQLMGGRISVESDEGTGSTFSFTAQFGLPCPAETAENRVGDVGEGRRALVVDDNASNLRILENLLVGWGFEVLAAADGNEAAEKIRSARANDQSLHLVILDDDVPPDSGYALIREMRYRLGKRCPIVFMRHAGDQPRTAESWRALGIDAHLMKPVMEDELLAAIGQALRLDLPSVVPAAAIASSPNLSTLRILLVEDSLVNQRLMVALLKNEGHEVQVAIDGQQGLNAWESQTFDVILMDIQMPVLDGIEATRAIRKQERESGHHIPIIALTAHALKGDKDRFLEAGMDAYVSKPVHAAHLLEVIAHTFKQLGIDRF